MMVASVVLPRPGRPEEQHMIQRFAAALCRFERDGQLLLRLGLADELRQPARPQLQLEGAVLLAARCRDQPLRIVVAALHNPECINRPVSSFAEVHRVGIGRHAGCSCCVATRKGLLAIHASAQCDQKRRMSGRGEDLRFELRILSPPVRWPCAAQPFVDVGVSDHVPDAAFAARRRGIGGRVCRRAAWPPIWPPVWAGLHRLGRPMRGRGVSGGSCRRRERQPAPLAAGFAVEAASPLIGACLAGRFEAYQKTTSAIAMRTMAAMATPGRLRGRETDFVLLERCARGGGDAGAAVRGVAARGTAAGVRRRPMEERPRLRRCTAGPLSTRRIAASEALLPAPARTSVAKGAGSCRASRSLEKRRPVSAL